jgi:hypothetical protein
MGARVWVGLLLATAIPAAAVIVDRVAVAVGARVITDSEITERIRLTAFENGATPAFDLAARRDAAQRLIDQKLIEQEMEVGHYPHLAAVRGDQLIADFIRDSYQSNRTAFDQALTRAELTPAEVQNDLVRQADLLTFLDLRFRPAVQVTQEDVRKYFDQKIAPLTGGDAFERMRAQIEQQLAGERSDAELNSWLKDARQRTRIAYLEPELAEQPAP